jgi:hypothetical protein
MGQQGPLSRVIPQDAEAWQAAGQQNQAAAKPAAPKLAAPAGMADQRQLENAPARDEDRAGQIYRYQQRLEQQAPQKSASGLRSNAAAEFNLTAPAGPKEKKRDKAMPPTTPGLGGEGMGMSGYGMGVGAGGSGVGGAAMGGYGGLGAYGPAPVAADALQPPTSGVSIAPGTPPAVAPPGYLASLDVELPVRGVEYMFTTPRGDTEITAQSISGETLDRLSMIAIISAAGLIVWLLARVYAAARQRRFFRVIASALLIVLGIALLIAGVTPLYALFALLSAIAIAIRR